MKRMIVIILLTALTGVALGEGGDGVSTTSLLMDILKDLGKLSEQNKTYRDRLYKLETVVKEMKRKEGARITALEKRLSRKVLWGVNSSDQIYLSKNNGKSWNRVSGGLKQISVGEGIVWGVNRNDDIYWSKNEGKNWTQVSGKLKHISVWP